MTSDRRRRANAANARHSTGPRTAAGKARVAKNAVRHGLSSVIDVADHEVVDRLCAAIAGPGADPVQGARSRALAEAIFDLRRVYDARLQLIQAAGKGSLAEPPRGITVAPPPPTSSESNAAAEADERHLDELAPEPANRRFLASIEELVANLERLERYERRARSRRRKAIRALESL